MPLTLNSILKENTSGFVVQFVALHKRTGDPLYGGDRTASLEIGGDRPSHRHTAYLVRRKKLCCNNLAMVELEPGQAIQAQFEERHAVLSPIPDATGIAGREQRGLQRQADLLGQFPPR